MKPPMLTIEQVCTRLQLGQKAVRSLIGSGELKAKKVARVWRVDEDVLEAFICGDDGRSPRSVTSSVADAFDADRLLTPVAHPRFS